jgi:hypothetical protein
VTLEEALVSVCKQALIDGATTVELEGRNYTVKKTSRHHLRQVDFIFDGRELRGLEQNPHTQSRWARLAQEGKRIMQFLCAGRYIAVVVDGKMVAYK